LPTTSTRSTSAPIASQTTLVVARVAVLRDLAAQGGALPGLDQRRRQLVHIAVGSQLTARLRLGQHGGEVLLPATEQPGQRGAGPVADVRHLERHAAQQAAEREVAQLVVVGHRREEATDPFERRRGLVPQQRPVASLDDVDEQRLLGLEVAVERALRHAGRIDDLLHAGAVAPAFRPSMMTDRRPGPSVL
jgi:hypothetical protein